MIVFYEWVAEKTDEHGDIVESEYVTRLREIADRVAEGWDIGLSRMDEYSREYAYAIDGKMPTWMDGGSKVPARYVKEWERR